ncbi:hypothetical protein VVT58_21230 (plasmid) [Sphingobium sp. SJ10-10]
MAILSMACGVSSPKQLFRVVTDAEGARAPYRLQTLRGGAPFHSLLHIIISSDRGNDHRPLERSRPACHARVPVDANGFSTLIFRALTQNPLLGGSFSTMSSGCRDIKESSKMLERLSDLDELILRCRTDEAREHIAEAVASYRGGAYRATIVMSWIAVVFDLMDKVRDLSIGGEAAASRILETFEIYQQQIHSGAQQATKQALEFEREILQKVFNDLSLIDAQQLTDLERLREDRHRCAHPSFNRVGEAFRPPAELARLHLRNAIAHVLSQPPVQGKAALEALKTLVSSAYFPTDLAKAKTQLASSALGHPTPTLVKNFIDALIFGYIELDDGFHQLPQALTALTIVADTHRGIAEPRIGQQFRKIFHKANDEELPTAVAFVAAWPAAWDLLDAANRDRVTHFIEGADYNEIEPSFPFLVHIPDLVPQLKERLLDFNTNQLAALLAEEGLRPIVVDAIIARYLKSNTYNHARIRRTRLLLPVLDHLTPDHIGYLVTKAAENDQVYDETGFPRLLNRIAKLNIIPFAAYKVLVEGSGFTDVLDEEEESDET